MSDLLPLAVAALLVGGLAWWLDDADVPITTPDDAADWAGHRVTVDGLIYRVHPGPTHVVLDLAGDDVLLRVIAPADEYHVGAAATAQGRLAAQPDGLVLFASRVTADPVDPGAAARPGWPQLAADPNHWQGRLIALPGSGDGTWFRGDGHRIASDYQGPGPLVGVLWFESACLCHVVAEATPSIG